MGYYSIIHTDGIGIDPPLSEELIARWKDSPTLTYFLSLSNDGDHIEATYDDGKAYMFWACFLEFVDDARKVGHIFNGTVTRQGEEGEDADRVVLTDGASYYQRAERVWVACGQNELR